MDVERTGYRDRKDAGSLNAGLQPMVQGRPTKHADCEDRYRILVEQAFDGVLLIDEESSNVLQASGSLLSLLGYTEPEAATTLTLSALLFDQNEHFTAAALVGAKRELRLARADGSALETEVRGVRFPADERSTLCLLFQDITERNRLERSLRHDATHDHLTGLPNRRLFAERIQQQISYHRRRQKTLAVLVLDLDNFKQVNDTLGHRAGDVLLREFADRLRATVREYDIVARFGGDEFQIGLIDVGSCDNVVHVTGKLLDLFRTPFQVAGHCVASVTASIGIALFPSDGDDAETLFTRADAALYESKRKGKRRFSFFAGEAKADGPAGSENGRGSGE